jgi:hypothetical protein
LVFAFKLELCAGSFRRRHLAADDHFLGEPDRRLHVAILSDDMLDMGEAMAGSVLNTPSTTRSRSTARRR